ncbi:MAG: cation diffusion facilitator family transporter [Treponema sp.]|nr:cation diffusion facilitator family transporter [Treponema sp.]
MKLISLAGWIALLGNLSLAIIKIVAGITAESLAVLGDGLDSATDVSIACMTLIISRIIQQPSDEHHPWGHGRAETTATMVVAFIIFYAGMQLSLSAGGKLFQHFTLLIQSTESTTISSPNTILLIVTILSIAGKLLLAWSQYHLGRKSGSIMILANAKNMATDSIISISVLVGLAGARIFSLPILDPLVAFLVGLWVLKNAISIFIQMNLELMDGNHDKELYHRLFTAVKTVQGVSNPHRVRIRKIAALWDIDMDIEVDPDITLHDAHELAEQVETAVRKAIPEVYDIVVHMEPAGHSGHHSQEQFGLSESDL